MIQSYINTITTLETNASPVTFQTDCIKTRSANCCGWLQHNSGSPLYKILKGGYYNVKFNANVSAATAGVVAFGLYMDGVLVPGATAITTLAAAGDYANIAIDKEIPICCNGDATFTIQSIPTVPTPTDVTTPITTQVPIITSANLQVIKDK